MKNLKKKHIHILEEWLETSQVVEVNFSEVAEEAVLRALSLKPN